MRTKIVYENAHMIVCHKPAGLATQSASLGSMDVASELKNYLKGDYVGMIHRLDQPVEGLLVFAKDKQTAAKLTEYLNNHLLRKSYLALVYGIFSDREGTYRDRLYRDSGSNRSMVVTKEDEGKWQQGKEASLRYEIVEENLNRGVTLVRVYLETGRHHQIRVQFATHAHPLIGDEKYGTEESRKISSECRYQTVCLIADSLTIPAMFGQPEKTFTIDCPFL